MTCETCHWRESGVVFGGRVKIRVRPFQVRRTTWPTPVSGASSGRAASARGEGSSGTTPALRQDGGRPAGGERLRGRQRKQRSVARRQGQSGQTPGLMRSASRGGVLHERGAEGGWRGPLSGVRCGGQEKDSVSEQDGAVPWGEDERLAPGGGARSVSEGTRKHGAGAQGHGRPAKRTRRPAGSGGAAARGGGAPAQHFVCSNPLPGTMRGHSQTIFRTNTNIVIAVNHRSGARMKTRCRVDGLGRHATVTDHFRSPLCAGS